MSRSNFEQAHQSELSSKAQWIASCQNYEASKDSFKVTLGLPPDARIEPRESDLAELEKYVGRYAELELGPYDMGGDDPGRIVLASPESVDGGELKRRTDTAIAIAFSNRLDFVSYRDRIEDAQRKLLIAEDALRAEVTLGTGVSNLADPAGPGMGRAGTDHGRLHPREWTANPLLTVDLPIERRSERNAYRSALVAVVRDSQCLGKPFLFAVCFGQERIQRDGVDLLQHVQYPIDRDVIKRHVGRSAVGDVALDHCGDVCVMRTHQVLFLGQPDRLVIHRGNHIDQPQRCLIRTVPADTATAGTFPANHVQLVPLRQLEHVERFQIGPIHILDDRVSTGIYVHSASPPLRAF